MKKFSAEEVREEIQGLKRDLGESVQLAVEMLEAFAELLERVERFDFKESYKLLDDFDELVAAVKVLKALSNNPDDVTYLNTLCDFGLTDQFNAGLKKLFKAAGLE